MLQEANILATHDTSGKARLGWMSVTSLGTCPLHALGQPWCPACILTPQQELRSWHHPEPLTPGESPQLSPAAAPSP